ncbi:hypothetical protein ACFQ4L_07595 [Lapidilactobacillus mulanensis]|uniref:Sugar specific permease n=1 Tax=Lapidilactobacillus mulanensis TaxID=2485999 RepID=A0ABW4DMM5_9LACO|nr:hypothetical protein [Lapidilactobacillus mulanensis]
MTTRLTVRQQIFYFVISIVLNGIGNGLTVALNLGSALWTASAVNISHASHLPLNAIMMLIALFAILVNIGLRGRVSFRAILGNIIFALPFSYLVGWFSSFFMQTPVVDLPLVARVLLDFVGIGLIGIAISIYQRLNIVLHPTDEMMQLVRFKWLHGNAWKAQISSFIPPMIAIMITFLLTHQLYAINLGTAFSLIFQGYIIGLADVVIFPKLKHQHLMQNPDK